MSQETMLPVFHLSATGLKPTEMGGGMQTRSLRLVDTAGKEWVLRSINKYPDALLPQALSKTFASNVLEDNFSANFPYGLLAVPVTADALGVPYSNPSIVYMVPELHRIKKKHANIVLFTRCQRVDGYIGALIKCMSPVLH